MRNRICYFHCAVIAQLLLVVCSRAQEAELPLTLDSAGSPEAGATNGEPTTELDRILNMNLDELSRTSVIDPVVLGVSKKEETLSKSSGIVQVITAKEIRAFGAKNLFEVLNWATSVYTTGSYLYPDNAVSIRGDLLTHNDNHTLVLINGRPVRDVQESGLNSAIYLAFPLDAIHHVEIIRGPGSVLYGTNAYTGIINIVTKQPDVPTGRGAALAGTFGTQKYDVSRGNGNEDAGYLVAATYGRQEGWLFRATGEDHPTQSPAVTDSVQRGYEDIGVFAQAYRGDLTANVFFAGTSQTHMGALPTWPAGDLEMDRLFVDLGYVLEGCPGYKTDFHFTYNMLLHTWQFPTPPDASSHSYLFEVTHYRPITHNIDLMIGAFADMHQGESNVVPAFFETWYGVYAQLEYTPTDWLKLVGGVQGNMPGEIPGGVSPRASAILKLTDHWGAKLLYGEAFRSPYPLERNIVVPGTLIGNPALSPETINTYEAQLSYTTEKSRLAATYFFSEYEELITRVGALPATFQNLGTMTFQGIELESMWNPNEHWHMIGAVTWQQNIDDNDIIDRTHVPNWLGKIGVAYDDCRRLKVGLFHIVFSRPSPVTVVNPAAAIVNPPESSINLLSLDVRYDVSPWFGCRRCGPKAEIEFLAQNLLDDEINHPEFSRREINTLPAGGGQSFYGGFSIEY